MWNFYKAHSATYIVLQMMISHTYKSTHQSRELRAHGREKRNFFAPSHNLSLQHVLLIATMATFICRWNEIERSHAAFFFFFFNFKCTFLWCFLLPIRITLLDLTQIDVIPKVPSIQAKPIQHVYSSAQRNEKVIRQLACPVCNLHLIDSNSSPDWQIVPFQFDCRLWNFSSNYF